MVNSSKLSTALHRTNLDVNLAKIAEMTSFVESWEFIVGGTGRQRRAPLPFHQGWKLALGAIRGLVQKYMVDDPQLTFLFTRRLNQDHVENLHCLIRGHNGFNNHPCVTKYASALRSLACRFSTTELVQTTQPSGANCEPGVWEECEVEEEEEDELPASPESMGPPLTQPDEEDCSQHLFDDHDSVPETTPPSPSESCTPQDLNSQVDEWSDDEDFPPELLEESQETDPQSLSSIEEETVTYIAGAMVQSLQKKKHSCEECISSLRSGDAPEATFTSLKSYREGALINTSLPLRELTFALEHSFKSNIQDALISDHPREFILSSFLETCPDLSSFNCTEHHASIVQDYFKIYINTRIFFAVKLLNRSIRESRKGSELTKCRRLNF